MIYSTYVAFLAVSGIVRAIPYSTSVQCDSLHTTEASSVDESLTLGYEVEPSKTHKLQENYAIEPTKTHHAQNHHPTHDPQKTHHPHKEPQTPEEHMAKHACLSGCAKTYAACTAPCMANLLQMNFGLVAPCLAPCNAARKICHDACKMLEGADQGDDDDEDTAEPEPGSART